MYEKRFYRNWMDCDDLTPIRVAADKSDLFILCNGLLARDTAMGALKEVRSEIEKYILEHEGFLSSLAPVSVSDHAPRIATEMAAAGKAWNVGPMAAVAGAIAEHVGRRLAVDGGDVIVENGGDVFAKADRDLKFALYAGEDSPFKDKVAFRVNGKDGIGVCTSSGAVGPSISFGRADAVVAIADNTAFADAAATSIANQVRSKEDIELVIEEQKKRGDLRGIIACTGDRLGIWGDVEIIRR